MQWPVELEILGGSCLNYTEDQGIFLAIDESFTWLLCTRPLTAALLV